MWKFKKRKENKKKKKQKKRQKRKENRWGFLVQQLLSKPSVVKRDFSQLKQRELPQGQGQVWSADLVANVPD